MDFTTVNAYMQKLHGTDEYLQLDSEKQEKLVFTAMELLKDNFRRATLTDRAVALQALFMLEGSSGAGDDFAMLKRQGVKSYSVDGTSVTFEGGEISPDVVVLLQAGRARTARLT